MNKTHNKKVFNKSSAPGDRFYSNHIATTTNLVNFGQNYQKPSCLKGICSCRNWPIKKSAYIKEEEKFEKNWYWGI